MLYAPVNKFPALLRRFLDEPVYLAEVKVTLLKDTTLLTARLIEPLSHPLDLKCAPKDLELTRLTVMPTKSDSGVIFSLQLLSKT